jgi:ligand-binding sensor domain-containing protein
MKTLEFKHCLFIALLVPIFLISCNGQTLINKNITEENSVNKSEQPLQIVLKNKTSSEVVVCQLLDKEGSLWFSINGEGAYRYDRKIFTNFNEKNGLCSNDISSIIQDRSGNILFGTNKGICIYDGNKFSKYPIPDTLFITCMLEDKDGNLWFGTRNHGIYRYNGKSLDNFLNGNEPKFNLGNYHQFILDILQDRNGNLWFSSWNRGGVWKYDGKDFKNYIPSASYYETNQDKTGISNIQNILNNSLTNDLRSAQDYINDDMIFSMTEDHLGNIWFATRDHGICRYDGKTFKSIGKNEGFNARGATAILQDEKNHFWITTFDSGVWYYDGKNFKNFNTKDGLVNNAVMNVLKDKDGNLWFGTKYLGLSRYNGKNFTTFSNNNN